MNRRERILLGVVICGILLFAGTYLAKAIFVEPLRKLDRQTEALRDHLRQIQDERRAYFSAEDYLRNLAPRTFGPDSDTATAQAGRMLTEQIIGLGLQESQFSRLPVGPRRFRGAEEVGWSVQGEGPLPKMLDLLFVLEQTPQLHRIENLVLSSASQVGWVRARFRYLTLVIEDAPQGAKTALKPEYTLNSPQRGYYDCIVERDLLRPYIPRPRNEIADTAPSESADPPPEMLKVVSLSDWGGTPEVHVCDLRSMQVSSYGPGDTLAGAIIVGVDYRTLPSLDRPGFVCYSRLILKVGNDYWAVEPGQTLATKHPLIADQLPPQLREAGNQPKGSQLNLTGGNGGTEEK